MAGNLEPGESCDSCEAQQIHEGAVSKARSKAIDDNTVQRLSDIFKVMGDPTRLRIINALSAGEMCVCDIAAALDMENSAISHQLRILKAMRLVKFRKEGKSAYYSLDDEHMLTLFNEGLKHAQHK
jgi:ArsR family transcriptional regulator